MLYTKKLIMMKRILTLLTVAAFFILVSKTGYSQVRYNIQAGVNFSNLTNNLLPNTSSKTGFRAGLGINYNFSDFFSVDPSLLIVSKGFKQSDINLSVNPIYLQLPVNFTLNLPLTRNIKILIGAGPYVAYGIGGSGSIGLSSGETLVDAKMFSNESVFTYYNKFDAGLNSSVGVALGDIVLSLGGEWGFLKVNDYELNNKQHLNNSYYIALSYKF